jgi:hypothetical protein
MASLKSRLIDKLNELKVYTSPAEQAEINELLDELQKAGIMRVEPKYPEPK